MKKDAYSIPENWVHVCVSPLGHIFDAGGPIIMRCGSPYSVTLAQSRLYIDSGKSEVVPLVLWCGL